MRYSLIGHPTIELKIELQYCDNKRTFLMGQMFFEIFNSFTGFLATMSLELHPLNIFKTIIVYGLYFLSITTAR